MCEVAACSPDDSVFCAECNLSFRGTSRKALFETNSPHNMQVLWGEFVWFSGEVGRSSRAAHSRRGDFSADAL